MAGGGIDMMRHALVRQAQQSLLALGVATLGLLVVAPVAALIRALVAVGKESKLPIGETFFLVAGIILLAVMVQELASLNMKLKFHGWLNFRLVAFQAVAWAAAVAAAAAAGVEEIKAVGLPICALIHTIEMPIAVFLRPDLTSGRRKRRLVRELKLVPIRLCSLATGFSVIPYVYLTIFTRFEPFVEVLVMGLGMPLLQALCITCLAYMTEGQARMNRKALARRNKARAIADEPTSPDIVATKVEVSAKYARDSKSAARQSGQSMALIVVVGVETMFSTGAFTTLALAESEGTFCVSLVSMLAIEVAQVALHVKASRVAKRVVDESMAETLLGDDMTIRDWLLHQELGEKTGLLLALGFLAIDRVLGRDIAAMQAVDNGRLARRGLAMVLLELVGDLGKDLLGQFLGIIASDSSATHVSLPPLGVCLVVAVCLNACIHVQTGLALGTV